MYQYHTTKFYSISKVYSIKGCELKNSPGILQYDSVVKIRFVYNPILLVDPMEIFKFTPLNRVNFREMKLGFLLRSIGNPLISTKNFFNENKYDKLRLLPLYIVKETPW